MEKRIEKKTLLAWVRELLSLNGTSVGELPGEPPEEVVESLIGKASGETPADPPQKDKQESCAYATKRNIVASLQEIRKFAEKHNLGATMVRALLTLLAELAIGALKGKVGEKALEALLRAFNYQQHIEEAYLRGKNETIVTEYFPEADDIPHLGGMHREDPAADNIFTIARDA